MLVVVVHTSKMAKLTGKGLPEWLWDDLRAMVDNSDGWVATALQTTMSEMITECTRSVTKDGQ